MTDIEIAGLALGWIGTRGINSFDDDLDEARMCALFLDVARDSCLEDRLWTFATTRFQPNLLAEAPLFGYLHQFEVPATIIRVHRVDEAGGDGRLDWRLEGRNILTNAEEVFAIGVSRIVDTSLYSPNFCLAMAAKLASLIVIPLKDDEKKLAAMNTLYSLYLKNAAGTDGAQGRAEKVRSDSISRMR